MLNLFQHCGHDEPCLVDNGDALKQLSSLLKKIGEGRPLMLVLDNVCPGLESFVETLQVQVPFCKILIISRVVFPRFETLFLRPLGIDDAVTLFRRFALPDDVKRGTYVPDDEYVQQVSYICPISLNVLSPRLHLAEHFVKFVLCVYNCVSQYIMKESVGGLLTLKL